MNSLEIVYVLCMLSRRETKGGLMGWGGKKQTRIFNVRLKPNARGFKIHKDLKKHVGLSTHMLLCEEWENGSISSEERRLHDLFRFASVTICLQEINVFFSSRGKEAVCQITCSRPR